MNYKDLQEYADLNDKQIEKFKTYFDLLIEWNNKINLTSIVEENEVITKHFADSLSILKYIKNNSKIIDVGTGAGFPGIPLKISNNTLEITLLDSLNKRINFLNLIIEKLNLENIETIHGRAEDFGHDIKHREKYDYAVCRAVAKLNVLAEYMLPYLKVGGTFICMKGPNIEEEIEIAQKALKILCGKIEKIESFELEGNQRNIIIIKKEKNTPKNFPRKSGVPSKQPIE